VTRLSPLQATIAISVVDGLALPAGEEFMGIIRAQDVRATEKDKVKIGESFRGGDVVRGVVVRDFSPDAVPQRWMPSMLTLHGYIGSTYLNCNAYRSH
jgi:exosome complex RNA-binding protein Csl4